MSFPPAPATPTLTAPPGCTSAPMAVTLRGLLRTTDPSSFGCALLPAVGLTSILSLVGSVYRGSFTSGVYYYNISLSPVGVSWSLDITLMNTACSSMAGGYSTGPSLLGSYPGITINAIGSGSPPCVCRTIVVLATSLVVTLV